MIVGMACRQFNVMVTHSTYSWAWLSKVLRGAHVRLHEASVAAKCVDFAFNDQVDLFRDSINFSVVFSAEANSWDEVLQSLEFPLNTLIQSPDEERIEPRIIRSKNSCRT
jgi:hypothetical protein